MNYRVAFLAPMICFALTCAAHAVAVGQIDDFQDGTLANWANGGQGAPPLMNIPTGGPGGAGDHFLQITSIGGGGPGSRLTAFNRDQWLGNYITAGVNGIDMDLLNTGTVTLSIRIAFKQDTSFGAPGYLSAAFLLPPDSAWHHTLFSITPGSMIAIGSPEPFNTFFTHPAELRLINEVGADNLNGDPIAAQLGVDNIRAVPEPATWILLSVAIPIALILRKRQSKHISEAEFRNQQSASAAVKVRSQYR
jgi:hypothetical protein